MSIDAPVFARAVPVLRVFDEAAARAFYCGFLGFVVDWEHRFHEGAPLYMQVARSGVLLHLTEHHGDACPGSTVFVPLEGLDALHAELGAKAYKYARPGIEPVDWGRQMRIADPFGNTLRFTETRSGGA